MFDTLAKSYHLLSTIKQTNSNLNHALHHQNQHKDTQHISTCFPTPKHQPSKYHLNQKQPILQLNTTSISIHFKFPMTQTNKLNIQFSNKYYITKNLNAIIDYQNKPTNQFQNLRIHNLTQTNKFNIQLIHIFSNQHKLHQKNKTQ